MRSQVLEVSSRTLIAVVRCTSAFTGCGILSYLRGNTESKRSPEQTCGPEKRNRQHRSDGRARQHCSGRARAALCRPRATLGRLWCAFNPRVLSPHHCAARGQPWDDGGARSTPECYRRRHRCCCWLLRVWPPARVAACARAADARLDHQLRSRRRNSFQEKNSSRRRRSPLASDGRAGSSCVWRWPSLLS